MSHAKSARLVALFASTLLVVAACGGGGPEGDVTTVTSGEAETSTTESSGTVDTTDTDDTTGGGGFTAECLDATQAMAAAVTAYTSGFAGAVTGNVDSDALEDSAGQIQAMADAAPDEIKDAFGVIAEELGKFYTALADIGYEPGNNPTAEQMAQLSALSEVVDQEAFDEAADSVEEWFDSNC